MNGVEWRFLVSNRKTSFSQECGLCREFHYDLPLSRSTFPNNLIAKIKVIDIVFNRQTFRNKTIEFYADVDYLYLQAPDDVSFLLDQVTASACQTSQ